MAFPPRFLDELRERLTLSDVIGRRIRLTRAGREFKACCPFHKEKSPSFYVNDDKGFFHCFGCGAHGDIIGFVMRHDNRSFPEAVEQLASDAGLAVPETSPQERARAAQEKSLYHLLDAAAAFFEGALYSAGNAGVLEYARGRGLADNTLAAFRIGYAPSEGAALIAHLREQGFSNDAMLEAGVARKSERDGSLYSFFRDRLMFPVANRRGQIVAFGGRILPDHLRPADRDGFKPPKYINSSETALFHKGRMVYADSLARQAVADGKPLVVVEGYMDVIAAHQAGFTGCVAPLGTALTEEQIAGLWAMQAGVVSKTIHMCFDGDDAGRRAASRALDRVLPLLKPDCHVRFIFLPQGEDPDSLLRVKGADAFQSAISQAMGMDDFMIRHAAGGRDLGKAEDRAGLEAALFEMTGRIADTGVQYHVRAALRAKLRDLFFAYNRPGGNKKQPSGSVPGMNVPLVRPATHQGGDIQTRILLAVAMNYPELFGTVADDLYALECTRTETASLRDHLLDILEEAGDPADVAGALAARAGAEIVDELLGQGLYVHARFARAGGDPAQALQGFRDVMATLHQARLKADLAAARADLANDLTPENEARVREYQDMLQKSGG